MKRCQSPPASAGQALTSVSGQGAEFYGMPGIELVCINLGESAAFWGEKVFKKPAAPAASAALKARQEAVQLWDARQLGEFKPAAHLPHLPHLPPFGALRHLRRPIGGPEALCGGGAFAS